ncbi:MAG: hypothetical protein ACXAAO_13960 [Candidatus Thorarchaeota archaeon]|jgi:hypothetical protein
MSSNVYCSYFAYGGIFLLAAVIMFFLGSTAMWPAEAARYQMYGLGAAAFAVIMFGVGIYKKTGESTAPTQEIASDDEGWSAPSS